MAANTDSNFYTVTDQPCDGRCSGFGTRSSCPPLIVLAMHSEFAVSGRMTPPTQHPRSPEAVQESRRLGYFSDALASSEYCGCTFAHRADQAGTRSSM
jgi:hypothetical protein